MFNYVAKGGGSRKLPGRVFGVEIIYALIKIM